MISYFPSFGQNMSNYKAENNRQVGKQSITNNINFNGYTNYWQDNYIQWHRYGNLFKIAIPDILPTILQSKIDVAEDLGLPGLLMQEGFLSQLFKSKYKVIEFPEIEDLNRLSDECNLLITLDPTSNLGKELDLKTNEIFGWAESLQSHQFNAVDFNRTKAYYLFKGEKTLFVISSTSKDDAKQLLSQISNAESIKEKYKIHKGWFGASTRYRSVTCSPGHPMELIGLGLNEGNSWFVFDGSMEYFVKNEYENWIKQVSLPIVIDFGSSPVYGCENYEGLQVQDMSTDASWIDFARNKKGYIFRPVYDPSKDNQQYDGFIANEGNKEQIDNEDTPFIYRTGSLSGNLTSSMVLFIEKDKLFTREALWDAILKRKSVAIMEQAKMMGPAKYRNALSLFYLDRLILEDYFDENLDIQTKVEGYDLIVSLKNYSTKKVSGDIEVLTSPSIKVENNLIENISLSVNETKVVRISLIPKKEAMGSTNPIRINFTMDDKVKTTVSMIELPPAISMNRLLYAHAPEVNFPVTLHNFTQNESFPVEIIVTKMESPSNIVFRQTQMCKIKTSSFKDLSFQLPLMPGNYKIQVEALGTISKSQIGVGKAEGSPYLYEMDLNSDGINEYRMENDSVQITLLRTGARVIEYIVKSKNDNIFFKSWPEQVHNHRSPYRMTRFYPYGGFEDFLGQASMETHQVYDAKIIKSEGDFVQLEMETDFFGNHLKKIFTLYGNSPLLEIRFELVFKNPEANVIGPQPILELGNSHGTEDVFTIPSKDGLKEYRMRMEDYYGQAIDVKEGWNGGYDTKEDISFLGAFPVSQPIYLHMWMNHPRNTDTPHYYAEFQPWTPIIQKSKMYFSYYIWGSSGHWQSTLSEFDKRNLITVQE